MKNLPLKKIIEYGTKAPSGHNTQPWLFKTSPNTIEVHPNFKRVLPIVDPDNHALYISLGCAVENVVIAAKNYGFNSIVKLLKDKNNKTFISITLNDKAKIQEDDLFNYIEKRQTTRNKYTKIPISSLNLNELSYSSNYKHIK